MTTSTTLKLPDALKARIVRLAEAAKRTPHAFMIEALEAHTVAVARRQEFVEAALTAEHEVAEYGVVYSADEVERYLDAKLSGRRSRKPRPEKR